MGRKELEKLIRDLHEETTMMTELVDSVILLQSQKRMRIRSVFSMFSPKV